MTMSPGAPPEAEAPAPSLRDVAAVFARRGNFTFGGGSATIAVLRDEIVTRRRWLTTHAVDLSFATSRLTPGTNLLAFNAAVGWLVRGARGALVALIAGSVPCSVLAVALSACYTTWSQDALVRLALRGALAAAVAVMIATGWTLVRPYWREASNAQLLVLAGGAFGLGHFGGVSPLSVLLVAAVLGWVWPQGARR